MKKIWNVSKIFIAFAAIVFCLVFTTKVIGGQSNISPAGASAIIPPECTGDLCFKVNGNSIGKFYASKSHDIGECLTVQNDYSNPIFIPHKTLSEINFFRDGGGNAKHYTIIGAISGPCCLPDGDACIAPGECCSGNCNVGFCSSCTLDGGACLVNGDCCSGGCNAGLCAPACTGTEGWSGWSSCSPPCGPGGKETRLCGAPVPFCAGDPCVGINSRDCGGGGCNWSCTKACGVPTAWLGPECFFDDNNCPAAGSGGPCDQGGACAPHGVGRFIHNHQCHPIGGGKSTCIGWRCDCK